MMRCVIITLCVIMTSCVKHTPAPVAAASRPASAPASQPTCVPRPLFDQLAKDYVELWKDSGLALVRCRENEAITQAGLDAANARVADLTLQRNLAIILGPIGASLIVGGIWAIAAHR